MTDNKEIYQQLDEMSFLKLNHSEVFLSLPKKEQFKYLFTKRLAATLLMIVVLVALVPSAIYMKDIVVNKLLKASPVDQASEIIKTVLNSPSSFSQKGGEVLWEGSTKEGEKAYVVSVKFDAANAFGAALRGCMYVAYSETKDRKASWNRDYGINDYTNLAQLCEQSTPKEIKLGMVKTLVDVNFGKDQFNVVQKSVSKNSDTTYASNSDSNEFSGAKLGEKIKEAKKSQLDIDGGPYFFTENKSLISSNATASSEDQILENPINRIAYFCQDNVFGKSKGDASVDGLTCASTVDEIEKSGWKKLCGVYSFRTFDFPLDVVYVKNNSYIEFHHNDKKVISLSEIGKFSDKKSFLTGFRECGEAENMKKTAQQKGFKSLGEFMIQ